jgi:DDE family transposase/acyl-CoA reductase LuxC
VADTTLAKGEPTANFITAVVAQPATASDEAGLPLVEQAQAHLGLEQPAEWYLDGAYVSAERLAQAQAEGRQLIGPAQSAPKKEGRFSVEDFQIFVEDRRAVCPAGQTSTQCSRLEQQDGDKVTYRFEFTTHCHNCPLREQCLGKDQRHRTITVGQYHTQLLRCDPNGRSDLTEALQSADHVRGKVSTVGLAAPEHKTQELATELAHWGASRICPLGQMQNPPLT